MAKCAVCGEVLDFTWRAGAENWDKVAIALVDEFGESMIDEDDDAEDPYNWWLTDVTVKDIVDFIKLMPVHVIASSIRIK